MYSSVENIIWTSGNSPNCGCKKQLGGIQKQFQTKNTGSQNPNTHYMDVMCTDLGRRAWVKSPKVTGTEEYSKSR